MNAKDQNIIHLFLEAVEKYPNNIAIVDGSKKITYAELEHEVIKTATYFKNKGVQSGDRVLVFVPMSIDLYRVVMALFYIGASAVFLDEWVSKERLLLCCRIAKCKAFIGVAKARVFGWFAKEIRDIPIKLSLRKRGGELLEPVRISNESTALITFTTGTTGTPKAADRTHQFLRAQFSELRRKINPQPTDIDMPVLPIFLFLNLAVGCTSVIAKFNSRKPKSLKPKTILRQIEQHQVTRIIASPFFIKTLGFHLTEEGKKVKSIKQILTGGAPVFPPEALIYCKAFPNTDVQIVFGSTEAEPISAISAEAIVADPVLLNNGLPVGKIHPSTSLMIIDITSDDLPYVRDIDHLELEEGNVGEIIVAGDHVLKKYFENPEAIAANKIKTDTTMWHRTGDSGFVKEGKLYLTGRCKQLIKHKGIVISPFIIENKLQSINGIAMGTIILKNGQLILAIESDLSELNVESLVADMDYDSIRLIRKMPRDPRHFSKIDYAKLDAII